MTNKDKVLSSITAEIDILTEISDILKKGGSLTIQANRNIDEVGSKVSKKYVVKSEAEWLSEFQTLLTELQTRKLQSLELAIKRIKNNQ